MSRVSLSLKRYASVELDNEVSEIGQFINETLRRHITRGHVANSLSLKRQNLKEEYVTN